LTFPLSYAILYTVPHPEEALYLRETTGELLNGGSPGFFRSRLTNNRESDTFNMPGREIKSPPRGTMPHPEEALYLRETTGELLNGGSPGFFRSRLTNNRESDTFNMPGREIKSPPRGTMPQTEEALYLRTPTGELLNSGSPGFFRSRLTNNRESDTFISARLEW